MDFLHEERVVSEFEIGCKRVDELNIAIEQTGIEHIIEPVENSPPVEPFVGMEFKSMDEAIYYYNEYANNKGFSMRIGRKMKSITDGVVIGQELLCSQGVCPKKYKERVDRVHIAPDESRVGCKAMLVVSRRGECKWYVSRLILEHNHEFTIPNSTNVLRAKGKRSTPQLNLINVLDESGVRPSNAEAHEQLHLNECNIRNYLNNKRQKTIEKGDAQLVLTYFQEQQAINPGFFYAIQVDKEGDLANCFWVDARSRMAYKYFGDVVTFDPTYLTDKYKMPFVPVTGMNHHQQSILFGCALLWDETEESFVWLLQTWLEAMFGHPPRTIITDQDQAITNAVARVFPDSVHHFCMWHIMKKVPDMLSDVYHQNEEFKFVFSKCIHQTVTPDEFELAWTYIISTYNLENNDWLKSIYLVREKWIPAYLRNTFCAGMSTTQRSESMNGFFKDYIRSSTPMSTFVLRYEEALDAHYEKIREKNLKTKNLKPVLKTLYPMEAEAAQLYTRKILRFFQDELIQSQKYISQKVEVIDGVYKYKVHEFDKDKPVYIVDVNLVSQEAICTCHKFEFEGILCKHILMVFRKKNILSLPTHYILSRWTMNSTQDKVAGILSEECKKNDLRSSMLWSNSVMVHSIVLSEKASRSDKHYNLAIAGLQELFDRLHSLPVEDEIGSTKDESVMEKGNMMCFQNKNITLLDPPHVASKGRPCSLRMKGHLENSRKTEETFAKCNIEGHTKNACPANKKSRGTPKFDGDISWFGDRDGCRGVPRGPPGEFGGEK